MKIIKESTVKTNHGVILLEKGDVINEGIIDTVTDVALDLAGLIPVAGEAFDVINATRYLKKAKDADNDADRLIAYLCAGISLISAIPEPVGDATKAGKWLMKITKATKIGKEAFQKYLQPIANIISANIDKLKKHAPEKFGSALERIGEVASQVNSDHVAVAESIIYTDKGTYKMEIGDSFNGML